MFERFKDKKGIRGFIYRAYNELDGLFTRADQHHIYMLAAGIAFNILIYLIPLFLVAIFVVNLIFNIENIGITLRDLLQDLMPPTESAKDVMDTILSEANKILDNSRFFGLIGLGGLLWISSLLISSLRTSLNTIFELPSPKIFVLYRLKDILLIIVMAILILIYSYVVPSLSFILQLIEQYVPARVEWFLSGIVVAASSLIASFILFYFIFRFVPNVRLPREIRLMSTGMCVLLIEISRHIFAFYISEISNYGKFYGTYAVIISIAIWIYYSSLIILLSAEVSKYIFDRRHDKKAKEEIMESHEFEDESESDSKI
ncbi:MAG: YihY/virulence factor BrkB family protein [Candidatus Kapaibacterium sp.]